jgi:hypothetical protein
MNNTTVRLMQLGGAVVFVLFLVAVRSLVKKNGFPSLSDITNAIILGAAVPSAVVLCIASTNPSSLASLPDIHIHMLVAAACLFYVSFGNLAEKSGLVSTKNKPQVAAPLEIEEASYGTETKKVDVTGILKNLVRSGPLETTVLNSMLGGDPCPGSRKTLVIKYTVGACSHTRYYPEDDKVTLP